MDSAKKIAGKMDMSLSFFIRCLIKEKLEKEDKAFFTCFNNGFEILREIATEIKNLRFDLKCLFKDKD